MQLLSPDEFVKPNYGHGQSAGSTIANIGPTVAKLLDAPFRGLPPLAESLWRPLLADGPIKRVAVVIIDALGQNLIESEAEHIQGILSRTTVKGEITSVFPSTTVNALSCIWTGHSPIQHSMVGLRMLFPEYGVVGQMIHLTPNFHRVKDALVHAGMEVEGFLQAPGIGEQFGAADIPVHAFKGIEIVDSALSRMHGRGCEGNHGAVSFADMMWQMRNTLENHQDEPLLAVGYWPTVDSLSHVYGPMHPAVKSDVHALLYQIETLLVEPLIQLGMQDTAVLIVADHGQQAVAQNKKLFLNEHPELARMLLIHGAGEPRMPYMYPRQAQLAAVETYIQDHLSDYMIAVQAQDVVDQGWLGESENAADIIHRLGDLVGFMRPGATFVNGVDERVSKWMIGKHGGLTPDEMRVPFLGIRI